ncbi:MAG TPA: type IV pilus modification protein PilV [Gammaproteobacteria bacterium]|nr:type IV pilus modification protein PilV [Gammaproteobacteria bacterium]
MLIRQTKIMNVQRGYVLLEVLISIVILAIGLLGVAKLQASTRQLEMESYQRAQAVILLQDMVSRLSANRASASCYAITDLSTGTPYLGTGETAPGSCASGAGKTAQQNAAVADLGQWHNLLLGNSEQIGNNNVGAMVGARGCVTYDAANDVYVVTVTWQGLMKTTAPSSGLSCAKDTYGDDAQRRAVSAVVQLAKLD